MRLARLRELSVERNGALVGILRYREIQRTCVERALAGEDPGAALRSTSVAWAMDEPAGALSADDSLSEAAQRLASLERGSLPVVEERDEVLHLVGILIESDLLRAAFDPWFRFRPR